MSTFNEEFNFDWAHFECLLGTDNPPPLPDWTNQHAQPYGGSFAGPNVANQYMAEPTMDDKFTAGLATNMPSNVPTGFAGEGLLPGFSIDGNAINPFAPFAPVAPIVPIISGAGLGQAQTQAIQRRQVESAKQRNRRVSAGRHNVALGQGHGSHSSRGETTMATPRGYGPPVFDHHGHVSVPCPQQLQFPVLAQSSLGFAESHRARGGEVGMYQMHLARQIVRDIKEHGSALGCAMRLPNDLSISAAEGFILCKLQAVREVPNVDVATNYAIGPPAVFVEPAAVLSAPVAPTAASIPVRCDRFNYILTSEPGIWDIDVRAHGSYGCSDGVPRILSDEGLEAISAAGVGIGAPSNQPRAPARKVAKGKRKRAPTAASGGSSKRPGPPAPAPAPNPAFVFSPAPASAPASAPAPVPAVAPSPPPIPSRAPSPVASPEAAAAAAAEEEWRREQHLQTMMRELQKATLAFTD